jgi:acetyl-CoA synthetase
MTTSIIRKSGNPDGTASPATGWAAARAHLAGLPGGGLNIAHEAVDRHVMAGHGDQTALIWLGREGDRKVISYAELAAEAARFAHVLRANGIGAGERLFLLSGRVPELYAATLGAMKAGVVVSPLFAAFGPEPVRARMEIGGASCLDGP